MKKEGHSAGPQAKEAMHREQSLRAAAKRQVRDAFRQHGGICPFKEIAIDVLEKDRALLREAYDQVVQEAEQLAEFARCRHLIPRMLKQRILSKADLARSLGIDPECSPLTPAYQGFCEALNNLREREVVDVAMDAQGNDFVYYLVDEVQALERQGLLHIEPTHQIQGLSTSRSLLELADLDQSYLQTQRRRKRG
ncbi:hypothetical protein C5B42_06020 [Candidatus Cerribacteria bacterium 'Amazon FNV 2010 28 9']|uniref:Uncharacterized protein n=1 Tax=Candidatus Cerribacteria bacterium 'Amazon FNV 2010 28 9' TaxID=2081795 RepID=A0A317JM93_9BACT|nr:MAG: hypothetical protein C5B42_06020 [Candidatus Cerribacteria bacterium 'Amazon FNV 2010 28 9']